MQGFPEKQEHLDWITRVWARFAATEPYEVKLNKHYEHYLNPEAIAAAKAPYMWKQGLIPVECLVNTIADSCKFFPAPIEAREIYCKAGFKPVDGRDADSLPFVGRGREAKEQH